jgi:cytochrome oxidase Cu insertion factor (SCO1/SenC/PrrC family)
MRPKMYPAILLLGCGLCFNSGGSAATSADHQQPSAQEPVKGPHRVLGKVPFSYSYTETLNLARQNGKPILAYFTYAT